MRRIVSASRTLAASLLVGCVAGTEAPLLDAEVAPITFDEEAIDAKEAREWEDVEAEALVLGPNEVVVEIGEDLALEVALRSPGSGNLVPALLPAQATVAGDADRLEITWVPTLADLGDHDFLFLVVDEANTNLVIAQKLVLVEVVTRLDLVEYGF